jgi:hypothetical protein
MTIVGSFEIYQGNDEELVYTVVDSTGAPVSSLAGAVITWSLAKNAHSDQLVTKTNADVITISGGTFTVPLIPTDTAALKGDYYAESNIVDVEGHVSTASADKVKIKEALLS